MLKTRKSKGTYVFAYVWGILPQLYFRRRFPVPASVGNVNAQSTGSAKPTPDRGALAQPGDRPPQRTDDPALTART